jgi:hypothetical protein
MDDEQRQPQSARDRRIGNLVLLGCLAAVVGIGLWLVFALDQHRKLDDCFTQRRRDCVPLDIQPR